MQLASWELRSLPCLPSQAAVQGLGSSGTEISAAIGLPPSLCQGFPAWVEAAAGTPDSNSAVVGVAAGCNGRTRESSCSSSLIRCSRFQSSSFYHLRVACRAVVGPICHDGAHILMTYRTSCIAYSAVWQSVIHQQQQSETDRFAENVAVSCGQNMGISHHSKLVRINLYERN